MTAEEYVVGELCTERAKREKLEKELTFEKAKADNLSEVVTALCEDLETLKKLVIYESEGKKFKFNSIWKTFEPDLYHKLCKIMGVNEDYEDQIKQECDIEC